MNLIAIVDRNWGIAKSGKQICTIPDDMRRFRELTDGEIVIMGIETYEVFGHALPGRRNIVLSSNICFSPTDAEVYGEIDYMLYVLELTAYDKKQFVIGGESIYRQLLHCCDRAYITYVNSDLGADQFCPNLDKESGWTIKGAESQNEYNGIQYQFRIYERCE